MTVHPHPTLTDTAALSAEQFDAAAWADLLANTLERVAAAGSSYHAVVERGNALELVRVFRFQRAQRKLEEGA